MCPIREILGYLGLPALAPENNTTIPKQSPRRALKAGPGFFEACKLRKFPTRRWEKRPSIRSKTWQVWDMTVHKICPKHSKIHTLFAACIYNFHNSISLLNIAELSIQIVRNLLQFYTKALGDTPWKSPAQFNWVTSLQYGSTFSMSAPQVQTRPVLSLYAVVKHCQGVYK